MLSQQAPARPFSLARRTRVAAQSLTRRSLGIICSSTPAAAPALPNSNGNGAHVAIVSAQGTSPAAAAAPAPAPAPLPGVVPPPAAYNNVVAAGATKAAMPAFKTFLMGIMAGCYISFGGFMAVTAATMCAGLGVGSPILTRLVMGALFPFGLLITLVCGAELYTGNTAMVTAAVLEKKASAKDLVKNWFWSYAGNLVGSLLLVGLVAGSGLLAASGVPAAMAVAKTSIPFGQAVVRGVLCNWLVCCAVWMAGAATSLPGKALAAYLPVMAFITMGLEHSVANMFFCSLGIVQGAPVSWGAFFTSNLLPVTLGNTLAGVLCMAGAYGIVYGTAGKPKAAAA